MVSLKLTFEWTFGSFFYCCLTDSKFKYNWNSNHYLLFSIINVLSFMFVYDWYDLIHIALISLDANNVLFLFSKISAFIGSANSDCYRLFRIMSVLICMSLHNCYVFICVDLMSLDVHSILLYLFENMFLYM